MFYVYVLQSAKDGDFYIGCTNDLKTRFDKHSKGKVAATYKRRPFKLIFYEAFTNKHDAFAREKWLKTGWGHNQLHKILSNYIKNLGG